MEKPLWNTPTIQKIDEACTAASRILNRGWDWPVEFTTQHGRRRVIHGPSEIETLPDDTTRRVARVYDEGVRSLFTDAIQAENRAGTQLARGAVDYALEDMREAVHLEEKVGDTTALRTPLRMIETMIAAFDQVEPGVRAVYESEPFYRCNGATRAAYRVAMQDLPRELWDLAMITMRRRRCRKDGLGCK